MNNRIFVLGGSSSNDVEVFDVEHMKWIDLRYPVPDLPQLTHSYIECDINITTGAIFNNRLVLFERYFSFLSFQYILARNDWTGFKKLRHYYKDLSIITARPAFFD